MPQITINNGEKVFEHDGQGQSLFHFLREQGVYVPTSCRGMGRCSLCRVKLNQDGGPITDAEKEFLSADDLDKGLRLSCQIKLDQDLDISLPEELINMNLLGAEFVEAIDLTHDIKAFRLKLDDPDFTFKAGQYIELQVPPYGQNSQTVQRTYSISSAPDEKGYIEFQARLVKMGVATTWLFRLLQPGERIYFAGPHGDFYLSDTGRDMICIAGGSGMGPIWSILQDMRQHDIKRKVRFFFGARTTQDLFLLEEMEKLKEDLHDFDFIPALNENDDGSWNGETGFINEVVEKHCDDLANCEAYMAGPPVMIDAAIETLHKLNMDDKDIHFDKFT